MKKHDPADLAHCSYCRIAEDIHLLDGVLNEHGDDTGKLACIKCYPDGGWAPTGIEHIELSIASTLKPLYAKWLARHIATNMLVYARKDLNTARLNLRNARRWHYHPLQIKSFERILLAHIDSVADAQQHMKEVGYALL